MKISDFTFVDIKGKKCDYTYDEKQNILFINLKHKMKTIDDLPFFSKCDKKYCSFTDCIINENSESSYMAYKNTDIFDYESLHDSDSIFMIEKMKIDYNEKWLMVLKQYMDINPYEIPFFIKIIDDDKSKKNKQTIVKFDKTTKTNYSLPIFFVVELVEQAKYTEKI